MNWKFTFVNPIANEIGQARMSSSKIEETVQEYNNSGYELVKIMTYQNLNYMPSLLLVFWRISAGACPMNLPVTAARQVELDVTE